MKKSEVMINKIKEYLQSYISLNGFPPTYREIGSGVGLKSINSVKEYLDSLETSGFIRKSQSKSRCIEIITNSYDKVTKMPLVGKVAAGSPILAEENIENYFSVSDSLFGKNKELFMLEVKGDSMIDAGINNGDFIIAQKQNIASNGDIVVAMIDDSATVKTFYKENNAVRLQPHNKLYQPIFSTEVEILGKVVGLIRKY